MNTTENNILIAEFMGGYIEEREKNFYVYNWNNKEDYPLGCVSITPFSMWGSKEETLKKLYEGLSNSKYGRWGKFHLSWDWLMPVVEKIESFNYGVEIIGNYTHIIGEPNTYNTRQSKIESVYNAVIEFIKWYNENKEV